MEFFESISCLIESRQLPHYSSFTDSTCSRPSCSLCSSSESHAESESYSEESESESSPRREKFSLNFTAKRPHIKNVNCHIPPLPILHPHLCSRSSLMSTSFNEITPIVSPLNSDNNLMSTAFNVPSVNLISEPFSNLSVNTICSNDSAASVYSNTDSLSTSVNNSAKHSRSFNDVIGDLMSTSFSNLSVNDSIPQSLNDFTTTEKSLNNKTNSISPSIPNKVSSNTKMTLFQDSKNLTSLFNNPTYESTSFDNASNKSSSVSNIESSSISTTFSNPTSNLINKSYSDLYNGFTSTNKYSMNTTPTMHGVKPPSFNTPPLTSMLFNNSNASDKPSTTSFYNPNGNMMSTSFSNLDTELMSDFGNSNKDLLAVSSSNPTDNSTIHNQSPIKSTKNHSAIEVPPPPSIRNSYNYVHNLPNKNYQLSQSCLGLSDLDEPDQRFHSRPPNTFTNVLQRQNSITSILQNHHKKNNKFKSTRTYRVNYDLDFIPSYGSCDNLSAKHSSASHVKTVSNASVNHLALNSRVQSKLNESKHSKQNFLQNWANPSISKEQKMSSNVPPLPIINSPFSIPKFSNQIPTPVETTTSNEKPKVKFSDTVTHILVPGSVRFLIIKFLLYLKIRYQFILTPDEYNIIL